MKFLCLGYGDGEAWNALTQNDREAVIDRCFDYDEELHRGGHWLEGGQALQAAETARTLQWKNGRVVVTDGPFTETKEQLGGVGVFEARDLDHAVELFARHPGLGLSAFEIRPVDEEAWRRNRETDERVRSAAPPADAVRFACLGYITEQVGAGRSSAEFDAMVRDCIAFDEARRRDGQWQGGIALQPPSTAKTLRLKRGQVVVTDGPYTEAKEWLGGVVVLGFRDPGHALEVMTTHPAIRYGIAIEIRAIDEEMTARWESRRGRVERRDEFEGST
jgi:hypothetical protein